MYHVDKLRYTVEEAERRKQLESALDAFLFGFVSKCIRGAWDIQDQWDYMVNELNNLGLEEYIQITQKAYDRTYKD